MRNLRSFFRSLEVAALSDCEMLVYSYIAQDCGVDARTVKSYFGILEDTLIVYMVPGFVKTAKQRAIAAPKFYFFDVGVANYLTLHRNLTPGSQDFGYAFEHLMIQEIMAYLGYNRSREPLTYWRTSGGMRLMRLSVMDV